MSIQGQEKKEIEETEIHSIKIIEHLRQVDIPVLEIEKIKSDIRQLIISTFAEVIKNGNIVGILKQAIQEATKEKVIEIPKFREIDITGLFVEAIEKITKDQEIIRYKEIVKDDYVMIPKALIKE